MHSSLIELTYIFRIIKICEYEDIEMMVRKVGIRYLIEFAIFVLLLIILETKSANSFLTEHISDYDGDNINNILSSMRLERDEYIRLKSYLLALDGADRGRYQFYPADGDFEGPINIDGEVLDAGNSKRQIKSLQHIDSNVEYLRDLANKYSDRWNSARGIAMKIHDEEDVDSAEFTQTENDPIDAELSHHTEDRTVNSPLATHDRLV